MGNESAFEELPNSPFDSNILIIKYVKIFIAMCIVELKFQNWMVTEVVSEDVVL